MQLAEPEHLGDAQRALSCRRRLDAPEPGVNVEVAPAGEGAVNHRLLEDDAAGAAGGDRLVGDVEAREPSARPRSG